MEESTIIHSKGIVLGRRFCTICRRWRQIHEFHIARRKGRKYLSSHCRVCNTVKKRNQRGFDKKEFKSQAPEAIKARKNASQRRVWQNIKNDPERLQSYQEYGRIWAEGKRREQGVDVRRKPKKYTVTSAQKDEIMLEVGPLRQWLLEKINEYETIERLSKAVSLSPRRIYSYLHEHEYVVSGMVDHLLWNEGSTLPSELYPQLGH